MKGFIDDEIEDERARQDEQWGGPKHDDEHQAYVWQDLIVKHARRLTISHREGAETYVVMAADDFRERLIKVAALAIAAIESWDRTEITKDIPEVPK